MAAKKRKTHAKAHVVKHKKRRVASNAHRPRTKTVVKYRARKSNPKVVVRYRKRHNKKHVRKTKRNPDIFGSRLGSKESLKMIGGGIVGVAAVKLVPTFLPTSMLGSIATSSFGKLAIAAVTATVAGWAAGKADKKFGEGVMFGGWMMVAAVGINIVAPSLYTQYIGMGDFVPGRFAVPQNPVRGAIAAPAAVPSHMPSASGKAMISSGMGRAYVPAY